MSNKFLKSQIKEILHSDDEILEYVRNAFGGDITYFKNEKELPKILSFYEDEESYLCTIDGLYGTFKTKLIDTSLSLLKTKVLVFRFKFFEATTLDDIFLSLLNDLRKFYQEEKINVSKIETTSLSQKINQYLTHINLPAVIVFDSLENVLSKKEDGTEKEEILNFIEHLSSLKKFKVIVASRLIYNDLFKTENQTRIKLQPFLKGELSEYYNVLGIKYEQEDIDKLFEFTRGNTNYIHITANIINTTKTSLETLTTDFSKKKITYEDFIMHEMISLIPENLRSSMYILTLIKMGLPRDYLCNSGFFTPEQLNYFIEKELLSEEYGYVFLRNYFKDYITTYISHFDRIKIHEYLRNFYESQLPLKPSQRVLPISRHTMREQIAYHGSLVSEIPKKENMDLAYREYMSSNPNEWAHTEPKAIDKLAKQAEENRKHNYNYKQKYELTKDEIALLGVPFELNPNKQKAAPALGPMPAPSNSNSKGKQKPAEIKIIPVSELIDKAEDLEAAHEYAAALELYKTALSQKTDEEHERRLEDILKGCANCSKKLNLVDEGVKYLQQIYDLHYSKKRFEEANYVLLDIAKTYKGSYKFLKAKEIYERFINAKLKPSNFIIANSYAGLAGIMEDSSNIDTAVENYKKAFDIAENIEDKSSFAEAYFRYALILDDSGRADEALTFYEKSIDAEKDLSSSYLSSAYTNIAEIQKEHRNLQMAYKNYIKALKYDAKSLNYEGIYYLCTRLASLGKELGEEKIQSKQILKYLLKALSAAKRLNDTFYITSSYMELGDYYNKKDDEKAIKAYLCARDSLISQEFDKEDLKKINGKIQNIQSKRV